MTASTTSVRSSTALFAAMVLSRIEHYEPLSQIGGCECYDKLEVRFTEERPTGVLCGHETEGAVQWKRHVWLDNPPALRYRDLFRLCYGSVLIGANSSTSKLSQSGRPSRRSSTAGVCSWRARSFGC
jgi:hypothetical protein